MTDDTRHRLAERAMEHLEQSGFELYKEGQALRRRGDTPVYG